MTIDQLPPLLTVEETKGLLRAGRNQVYREIAEGRIPHIRVGRSIRVLRDPLLRLIGVEPVNATAPADDDAGASLTAVHDRGDDQGEPGARSS